jgi:hypothetical protein
MVYTNLHSGVWILVKATFAHTFRKNMDISAHNLPILLQEFCLLYFLLFFEVRQGSHVSAFDYCAFSEWHIFGTMLAPSEYDTVAQSIYYYIGHT